MVRGDGAGVRQDLSVPADSTGRPSYARRVTPHRGSDVLADNHLIHLIHKVFADLGLRVTRQFDGTTVRHHPARTG
ncbi:hypothetical protein [Streptomyces sp. NPDC054765]